MSSYITPIKIHKTHFACVSSRNLQNWDRIITYIWFKSVRKCVFAYMVVATKYAKTHDKEVKAASVNNVFVCFLLTVYSTILIRQEINV